MKLPDGQGGNGHGNSKGVGGEIRRGVGGTGANDAVATTHELNNQPAGADVVDEADPVGEPPSLVDGSLPEVRRDASSIIETANVPSRA